MESRTTTLSTIERALLGSGMPRGSRILLAVSGGADSVAMLDAMVRVSTRQECDWILRVAHVNHGLRDSESDADERFVTSLAESYGLEVEVAHANVRAVSAARGLSIEAAAREERYRLLEGLLDRWPGDIIVTAHTEDDQAETLLLQLLRGAGLTGMGAMRPLTGRLARPMLGVSRQSIIQYVQDRALPYRVDSSNLDRAHLRNRLRQELMPILRQLNPAAVKTLARHASLAQIDADLIEREATSALRALNMIASDDEVSADLSSWRALHPALRRACIRLMVRRLLGSLTELSSTHITTVESALLRAGVDHLEHRLPRGLILIAGASRFRLRSTPDLEPSPVEHAELTVPGSLTLSVGSVTAVRLDVSVAGSLETLRAVCGPNHALCDADALGTTLTVRSRRPGDRIRPVGLKGSRKVQDVLVDHKVPASQRDRVPIVENHQHLVWIPGHALDERVAAVAENAQVIHLSFVPVQSSPKC
jgi:tRNA(Ile)-lysidine synthetase-like protein